LVVPEAKTAGGKGAPEEGKERNMGGGALSSSKEGHKKKKKKKSQVMGYSVFPVF